jgi:aryl-alcohol dehydrogenase-like predicted oxidoreductase
MIPRRELGKTGEMLSIVGFGGIMVSGTTPDEAASLVSMAFERGVNYFDVAPSYGNAEEMLGPAIEPYRDRIFLACKTLERTRDKAQAELERSLQRLRTDHIDLYQLHAMNTDDDIETALGPGGVAETLLAAREKGLIRYVGFSTHAVDAALRLLDAFDFDSVLFPLNWLAATKGKFGPQILQRAAEKGVGRLILKAMARQRYAPGVGRHYAKCWYEPADDPEEAKLALRYTLSQDVTAALPPGEQCFFPWALEVAEDFQPLSTEEFATLQMKATDWLPVFTHDTQ